MCNCEDCDDLGLPMGPKGDTGAAGTVTSGYAYFTTPVNITAGGGATDVISLGSLVAGTYVINFDATFSSSSTTLVGNFGVYVNGTVEVGSSRAIGAGAGTGITSYQKQAITCRVTLGSTLPVIIKATTTTGDVVVASGAYTYIKVA